MHVILFSLATTFRALCELATSINSFYDSILESIHKDLPESTWTAIDVERYREEVRFSLSVPEWIHESLVRSVNANNDAKDSRLIVQRSVNARYTDIHAVRALVKNWRDYCINPLRVVRGAIQVPCSREPHGNGYRWELASDQASNYILGLSLAEYNSLTSNT